MKRTAITIVIAALVASAHCTSSTLTRQWVEKERAKRRANIARIQQLLAMEQGASSQLDAIIQELDDITTGPAHTTGTASRARAASPMLSE